MRFLRNILIFGLTCISFLLFARAHQGIAKKHRHLKDPVEVKNENRQKTLSEKRALHIADSLSHWLKKNGYSSNLIFLADMGLPMNINRFYIVNADSHIVKQRFLVAHGSGKGSSNDSAVFSNKPGSLCTAPGKYKIGKELFGEYGKGYWLDGLDATNNNARKRLIVFHYYLMQTSVENSNHHYFSSGCPMLAKTSFDVCDSLIQKESKPVLMYIYR